MVRFPLNSRTVIGTNRPDSLFSKESKSIVTTSDRATLATSSRLKPTTRRKELFATIKLSVARLPIALGNPNLSSTLHAEIIDSYIGLERGKILA